VAKKGGLKNNKKAQNVYCAWACGNWVRAPRTVCDECEERERRQTKSWEGTRETKANEIDY